MSFHEIDLLGVYVAPIALLLIAAWFVTIGLRRIADRFGVLRHVWHPALFVFAVAKTFWPKRSVALPTMPPDAKPAFDVTRELTALRADNERLRERLAALEEAVAHETATREE